MQLHTYGSHLNQQKKTMAEASFHELGSVVQLTPRIEEKQCLCEKYIRILDNLGGGLHSRSGL